MLQNYTIELLQKSDYDERFKKHINSRLKNFHGKQPFSVDNKNLFPKLCNGKKASQSSNSFI